MDGNEAASFIAYNFTDVAGIYPITPASPMAELADSWSKTGKKNYWGNPVKIVEMESEAGASGMVHGSLQAGCLTTTFTASQGLLLMIPNMYKIAGELLPGVIHVAARSLATHALSIFGDHQDIYAARMTGFALLASSSVQQVMDLAGVAHLAAIKGSVPFLHFFDGFRTSHELQKIEVIDTEKLKSLIDENALMAFRKKALNPMNPVTRGTSQNDDIYFQATEVRNPYYEALPDIVNNYMKEISKITGRSYAPFVYHGSKKATKVIVAMGSVCETIKKTMEYLNKDNDEYGLIEVHLYRPFSSKYLLEVLPETVKSIAVLDRTKEPGSRGEPLYLDVVEVLKESRKNVKVIGGRYGLSSKDTTPAQIKAVYDFLAKKDNFTGFTIGIEDDVTNLSLPLSDFCLPDKSISFVVYGYGSDGMVSACKDLMKITGEASNAYVQGYFQYDSKKSGGVTKSHLRFGKKPIEAPYYIQNPYFVVCTKDSYLKKYRLLDDIQEKGIFLLNTDKNEEEILSFLGEHDKNILKNRKISFYIMDADKIASSCNLKHKISMIMEATIFKLSHLIPYDFAREKMNEAIDVRFGKKGGNIAEKNKKTLSMIEDVCQKVSLAKVEINEEKEKSKDFFTMVDERLGNDLPVSAFKDMADGTWNPGLSRLEKRSISDVAPCFLKENCIECNLCSLVCPHAVIRPFLLNEEEVEKAPEVVKNNLLDANIKGENLKYTISASLPDCTGCGLCVGICPGKNGNKALTMENIEKLLKKKKDEEYKYLFNEVTEKEVMSTATVKGSQFKTPKFEFSGACAGCGETPYLKLLTQLFDKSLVIANATGCSSIYGASAPSTPYSVPWANSLFEDNAEYGFGMKIADDTLKRSITNAIREEFSKIKKADLEIYKNYLENINFENALKLYNIADKSPIERVKELKDFILPKNVWMVGGDGWAYDIGFNGIDHVLASNENINILVLDTEVYSNTGGQASKSTKYGAIAKFAATGKETAKKDLAKIALTYPHVYVGSISLGANPAQAVKILNEAANYNGPSIVIAYAPCIAQGILKGMENAIHEEKIATLSGYYPIFHYNPETKEFSLDSKADFEKYYEFLAGEDRYKMLKSVVPEEYKKILEQNKINAIERYSYYENLAEKLKD